MNDLIHSNYIALWSTENTKTHDYKIPLTFGTDSQDKKKDINFYGQKHLLVTVMYTRHQAP